MELCFRCQEKYYTLLKGNYKEYELKNFNDKIKNETLQKFKKT